jgi:glutathione S-transferase
MLSLYGHVTSRAARCLWALEEIGLGYKHIPTHQFNGETRVPEFLAINPNGHVPVLVDGGLKLFESMAINLYLAAHYGDSLWPSGVADQGRTWQWSFWALTELEPHLVQMMGEVIYKQPNEADAERIEDAKRQMDRPLKVLEAHLSNRQYLLSDYFSIADLNVASVLGIAALMQFGLSGYSNVDRWLSACWTRQANLRVDPQL